MYKAPTAPLSIGQVLDHGFRLFRASFSSVWPFALAGSLVGLPSYIVEVVYVDDPAPPPAFVLLDLAIYAITLIIYAAITVQIARVARGDETPRAEAAWIGVGRAPALLLVGLLYSLTVIVGLILLVVPGIWLAVAFVFGFIAVVLERHGPIQSLGYSFRLVKGHWWRTAAILTVITVIIFVVYAVLGLVASPALFGIGAASTTGETPVAFLLMFLIIVSLIQIVVMPLYYAMGIAVYNDLKLRHEGSDLAQRIDAAGAPSRR